MTHPKIKLTYDTDFTDMQSNVDDVLLDNEFATERIKLTLRGARVLGRYIRARFKKISTFEKISMGTMLFDMIPKQSDKSGDSEGSGDETPRKLTTNTEKSVALPTYQTLKNIIIALNEVPDTVTDVLDTSRLPNSKTEMEAFISRSRLQIQKVTDLGIYIHEETDTIKKKDLPEKRKRDDARELGYKDESIVALSESFNKVVKYFRAKLKDMRNELEKVQKQSDEINVKLEDAGTEDVHNTTSKNKDKDKKQPRNDQQRQNKEKERQREDKVQQSDDKNKNKEDKQESSDQNSSQDKLIANAEALKFKTKLVDYTLDQAIANIRFARDAISDLESQYDKKVFNDKSDE